MSSYLFYDAYDGGDLQTAVQTGNSSEVNTGWNARRVNSGNYSQQINGERQGTGTFSTTTPTTTNGNFNFSAGSPTQGFITPSFDALNLPSGQWTINQEVRTEEASGNAAGQFAYFLFKVATPATSSGAYSATAIPMYSDAALTSQISGPVLSSEATSIGTTAQNCSTTFYTGRIFLEIDCFYLQVWWYVTNRENNRQRSRIMYANGATGEDASITLSYSNAPFNVESPNFKRKRFVIS
jgi:hypothetical protein